jgi:uncharacterized protein
VNQQLLKPPFDFETATRKVRAAEDLWNTTDPSKVVMAYSADSRWRNRTEVLLGRDAIRDFLAAKWSAELDYRLIKELWGFRENRMAVRFSYESRNDRGDWTRSFGNELWEFDPDGLMRRRHATINDLDINEGERLFRWPAGPRPHNHPGLTDLDL